MQYMDHELGLAQAWVAASQGVVSGAISIARSAAETAAANGQFAAEVMCLQTATQFGDPSTGPRLRALAEIVEGPRAGLAAKFAAALHARDGAELAAVSEEFEEMGDLVAAVDSAAHAASVYRGHELRGSAFTYAARAEELAETCGGAVTPALRGAVEPLPLSPREREIVTLIAEGLSNREVADRLYPVHADDRRPHLPGDGQNRHGESGGACGIGEAQTSAREAYRRQLVIEERQQCARGLVMATEERFVVAARQPSQLATGCSTSRADRGSGRGDTVVVIGDNQ